MLWFRVCAALSERAESMLDFMADLPWWFFVIMGLILVALIGLLLFLRNRRPED